MIKVITKYAGMQGQAMDAPQNMIILALMQLAVSIVIICALTWFLRKSTIKINELKKSQNNRIPSDEEHNIIDRFLERELKLTETIISTKQITHPIQESALDFRHNMLQFELGNIADNGHSPSNITNIQKAIIKYLKDLQWGKSSKQKNDRKFKSSLPSEGEKAQADVSRLKKMVEVQKETIKKLKAEMQKIPSEMKEDALSKLEANPGKIAQIEQQIVDANKGVHEIHQKIITTSKHNHNNLEITTKPTPKHIIENDSHLKSLISDVKGKYEVSLNEIQNLRYSNKNKRKTILQLESEINKIKEKDTDSTLELIEQLKLQLRDSELCTAVLESEADNLRQQLENLIHTEDTNDIAAPIIADDPPITEECFKVITESLVEIANSNEANEIAMTLITACEHLDIPATINVSNSTNDYWAAVDGKVDQSIKKTLLSIQPDKKPAWFNIEKGLALCIEHCRCYIHTDIHNSVITDILSKLCITTSTTIKRIENDGQMGKQKSILTSLIQKTRKSIGSLETQNKYLTTEGKAQVESFKNNVSDFVESLVLSDMQTELFEEIVQEFEANLSILFDNRVVLDKSFVDLIEMLNSRTVKTVD